MSRNFAQNELKPGEAVGNYIVDSQVGQGTFGTVYKAYKSAEARWDPEQRNYLAIKRIFQTPDKEESENNLKSAELESIFHKMAQDKSSLFVQLHEVFVDDRRSHQFHLVLECCHGDNLMERYVAKNEIPDIKDLLYLCRQFFQALDHLRKVKIVHADIKPENIMFTRKSSHDIKIIDFGNSTPDDTSSFNREGGLIGSISDKLRAKKAKSYDLSKVICPKKSRIVCTAEYRPAEVLFEFEWSFPVDVYSMGCIIYELLAGQSLMPGGLDDDYEYENFYNEHHREKDLIDECASDSHQEDGIGIIMKRRHLRCLELIAKKNKYDTKGFEPIIFNEDNNTYRHSKKKRGAICKIVKWCMVSDSQDQQVVDTDWVDLQHLAEDQKHLATVDFAMYDKEKKRQLRTERDGLYHSLMLLVMKMLIIDPELRVNSHDLLKQLDEIEDCYRLRQTAKESRKRSPEEKAREREKDRRDLSLKRTFTTSDKTKAPEPTSRRRQVQYNEDGGARRQRSPEHSRSKDHQRVKFNDKSLQSFERSKYQAASDRLKSPTRSQPEPHFSEERRKAREDRFGSIHDRISYPERQSNYSDRSTSFNSDIPKEDYMPVPITEQDLDARDKRIDNVTKRFSERFADKYANSKGKRKIDDKTEKVIFAGMRLFDGAVNNFKRNERKNYKRKAPKRSFEYDGDKVKDRPKNGVKAQNSRSDRRASVHARLGGGGDSKRRRKSDLLDEFNDPEDPNNIKRNTKVKIKISKHLVQVDPVEAWKEIKGQSSEIAIRSCHFDPISVSSHPEEKYSCCVIWKVPISVNKKLEVCSEGKGVDKLASRSRAVRKGLEEILAECQVDYR